MSSQHPNTPFDYLSQHEWLIFDEKNNPDTLKAESALALQDTFIRWLPLMHQTKELTAAVKPTALMHFYPLPHQTILLGAKDKLLKEFGEANQFLSQQGYQISLRPHGGLAVVVDSGVFNLALVSDTEQFPLSIDEAYEQMVRLIGLVLAKYHLTLESYEVPDSYCPGRYDLVVNGLKIGGIAQRRFKSGVTCAAYISVNGDQQKRAELIQTYYDIGQSDHRFPQVNPASMASLTDFMSEKLSLDQFKNDLLNVLADYSSYQDGNFQEETLQDIYTSRFAAAVKRSATVYPLS